MGVFQIILLLFTVGISAAVITFIVIAITKKPKKTCPGCGRSVAASSGFCPYCGAGLRAPAAAAGFRAPVSAVCSACGASMPDGVRFCPNCGRAASAPDPFGSDRPYVPDGFGGREEILPADPPEAFGIRPFLGRDAEDCDPGDKTVRIRPTPMHYPAADEMHTYRAPDYEAEPAPRPVRLAKEAEPASPPKPAPAAAFSMPDDSDL